MESVIQNRTARKHLDNRLRRKDLLPALAPPPRGWIKAIREALGMSTAQLAQRMGVKQPSVVAIEQSESLGRIQLDTLQRAAAALNCSLVYALVPNEPLEDMVRARARQIAAAHLGSVEHTMALEDQSAIGDPAERDRQLDALAAEIKPRAIWDE
jgi:predicted DNA-binding mobile mystery protein A